jgi:inner membrane protein
MRNSAIARLVVIGALTIGLLVPLLWVLNLVSERAARRDDAVAEVGATWGGPQVIGGPILSVPYTVVWTDNVGRLLRTTFIAQFLPHDLTIDGDVATELRRRGIFEVTVYRSKLKIAGRFVRPEATWTRPAVERVAWDQASIHVGISDSKGLTRRASLVWRGQPESFAGGTADVGLFHTGIHAAVPSLEDVAPGTELPFEFTIELNGTRDLRFLPTAEETTVAVTSPWPHPSFAGAALPVTRDVSGTGFSARWRLQDFGRAYPAHWTTEHTDNAQLANQAAESAFGLSFIQPVDIYQQAERAVKYAVLFILLTFLVFFLWEVFSAALLHPVQYVFVGLAMCVFYLLLVSFSEHVGFDAAYLMSSAATLLLIAGYARAVLGGVRQGASVAAALTTLYGFLYLLLRLEDYALLAGSVGVLLVLALVMFVTRRMNWYELRLGRATPES